MAEIEKLNGHEDIETFAHETTITNFAFTVDGNVTDVAFCNYTDRQLIIITQFQKIGTLISVTKGYARNLSGTSSAYEVKTICGVDNEEYHLASRYLAEQLDIVKPVLFGICLKNVNVKTLKIIAKALKNHLKL